MSEPLLVARGVSKTYRMGSQELPVLSDLNLTLMPGEAVAVVGASGVGKSTLLHVLGLLDTPDAGEVIFGGEELSALPQDLRAEWRNRMFGFVFQFYHLIPELSALENVTLPGLMHAKRSERAGLRERAREILVELGLGDRLRHRPSQLSGGERQRVAIARALVNEPAVLLCDEPTGNLDPATSVGVQDALWALRERRGQAMLLVTHDEELAAKADRILRMTDGGLEEVSRREEPVAPAAETEPIRVEKIRHQPLAQTLLSLEGRIGRTAWWLGGLLPILLIAAAGGAVYRFVGGENPDLLAGLAIFTLGLFLLWPVSAILIKRCHDRDRSGLFLLQFIVGAPLLGALVWAIEGGWGESWWYALAILPGIPVLRVLFELLIRRGTRGPNRFGADPIRKIYGHRPG